MSSMADAAAARREARRKRILENSHNRLQLISGKIDDETPGESSVRTVIFSRADESETPCTLTTTSKQSLNNGLLTTESDLLDFLPARQDAAGDAEVTNDLAAFLSTAPEPIQSRRTWDYVLIHNKYDIVLLSLLIQILYSLSILTFESTYFFLPLIIYIITKQTWFPTDRDENNSSIANMLLILNGIPMNRVNKIMLVLQWAAEIFQDVSVFLFTTICIQTFYVTLKDNLIT